MEIRLSSRAEELAFAVRHAQLTTSDAWTPTEACSCGWRGADWSRHIHAALGAWIDERRRALRMRLLREEGVDRP